MTDHPSDSADKSSDTTKNVTVSAPAATAEATAVANASVTIGFSADNIRDRLENGTITEALVMTSTRLESVLSRAIADRYDITDEQFEKLYGRESLGRYQDMTAVLGLFDEHQETLQDVVRYRKNLVHEYGYLETLDIDDDEREAAKAVIEDAITFIEQTEI
ncbi:hypothetical protein [Natrinema salinisoli]|uniref:hypothetical protein n=1 Tax=Natrinema salinisoli TaxID=2878535 RepID=UPI001CEFFC82|nr:hypothetical protein [Natrinema salinisoli]